MSTAFSLTTLVGALQAAHEFIDPLRWQAVNDEQQALLERYGKYATAIEHMSSLKCWAKRTAEEINEILAEHGFSIRLKSWGNDPNRFGTVSINDILVEWSEPGTPKELKTEAGTYDGFLMPSHSFDVIWVAGHDEPILELSTKGAELVYITVAPDPGGLLELVEAVEKLRSGTWRLGGDFEKVHLPMVKLDQRPDIDWVLGLNSGPWEVAEAVQQVIFGMSQHGARAKEATALAIVFRGMAPAPKIYRVDRPFLVWIEHPDVEVPVFQAYITTEHWNDPGDLAQL
ncbi:MAG: hypothetical protein ABIP74_05215 [Candidatus Saccharimonas sp.]